MNTSMPLHPTFEELLHLTVDELPAERAAEIREHLLDCPACLEKARELLRLPDEPPEARLEVSDSQQEAAWQRLTKAIAAEDLQNLENAATHPPAPVQGDTPGPAHPAPLPFVKPATSRYALPLAAVLALGIGIAFGRFDHSGGVRGAALTGLSSDATFHRGENDPGTVANCPPENGTFVWVMVPEFSNGAAPSSVSVVIRADTGHELDRLKLPVTRRGEVVLDGRQDERPRDVPRHDLQVRPVRLPRVVRCDA